MPWGGFAADEAARPADWRGDRTYAPLPNWLYGDYNGQLYGGVSKTLEEHTDDEIARLIAARHVVVVKTDGSATDGVSQLPGAVAGTYVVSGSDAAFGGGTCTILNLAKAVKYLRDTWNEGLVMLLEADGWLNANLPQGALFLRNDGGNFLGSLRSDGYVDWGGRQNSTAAQTFGIVCPGQNKLRMTSMRRTTLPWSSGSGPRTCRPFDMPYNGGPSTATSLWGLRIVQGVECVGMAAMSIASATTEAAIQVVFRDVNYHHYYGGQRLYNLFPPEYPLGYYIPPGFGSVRQGSGIKDEIYFINSALHHGCGVDQNGNHGGDTGDRHLCYFKGLHFEAINSEFYACAGPLGYTLKINCKTNVLWNSTTSNGGTPDGRYDHNTTGAGDHWLVPLNYFWGNGAEPIHITPASRTLIHNSNVVGHWEPWPSPRVPFIAAASDPGSGNSGRVGLVLFRWNAAECAEQAIWTEDDGLTEEHYYFQWDRNDALNPENGVNDYWTTAGGGGDLYWDAMRDYGGAEGSDAGVMDPRNPYLQSHGCWVTGTTLFTYINGTGFASQRAVVWHRSGDYPNCRGFIDTDGSMNLDINDWKFRQNNPIPTTGNDICRNRVWVEGAATGGGVTFQSLDSNHNPISGAQALTGIYEWNAPASDSGTLAPASWRLASHTFPIPTMPFFNWITPPSPTDPGEEEHGSRPNTTITSRPGSLGGFAVVGTDGLDTATLTASGVGVEYQVVGGVAVATLTLSGVNWANPLTDEAKQAIIDLSSGSDAGGTGWNDEVKPNLVPADVTRASDTVVTIALDFAAYAIAANETVTFGAPMSALSTRVAISSAGTYQIFAGAAPIVVLSGSITDATEAQVRDGGLVLEIAIQEDEFVASGAFDNTVKQAILDGITAATSPASGWNTAVRDIQTTATVARTSNTLVTITFEAAAGYFIPSDEDIEVTVPAGALVGGQAAAATTTFTIRRFDRTITLAGSFSTAATEEDVRDGGLVITITIDGDEFVEPGDFDDTVKQDVLDGMLANSSFLHGWNIEVQPNLAPADLARTSATVLTLTLPAMAGYYVPFDEELMLSLPASALKSGDFVNPLGPLVITAESTVAVVSGRATLEQMIAGNAVLTITLIGDEQFVDPLTDPIKQAIIDGLVGSDTAGNGFNDEVQPNLAPGDVVRADDFTVTVVFPAAASYALTNDRETITATVPASAVTSETEMVAGGRFGAGTFASGIGALTVQRRRRANR